MKRLLLLVVSTLLVSTSYSQYIENVNYHVEIKAGMMKAQEGTYQISINPKYSPVFTDEILYFIELRRKDNEDIIISLMDCADLYIPSREKINSNSFVPLTSITH